MKKIYLSILGIAALSCSYAQMSIETKERVLETQKKEQVTPSSSKAKNKSEKALGTPIFTSDFTNTSDWTTATPSGTAVTGTGWNVNGTVESTFFAGDRILSTSGGNFAELWNGSYSAPNVGATHTLTTANPIVISTNNLTLKFEQFGAVFNDEQEMYISTDNTTWVKVGDNSDIPALTGSGGSRFDNPTVKEIVLSNYISGSATSLWVRFSWTSANQTSTLPGWWFSYGWMIDDVAVSTLADDDLLIINSVLSAGAQSLMYTKVPLHQATALHFASNIVNIGGNTSNDAALSVTITGGSTYTSAPAMISPMDTTLFESEEFTLTQTGVYNYTATATTSADDNSSNNSRMGSFEITQSKFTVEDGSNSGSFSNTTSNIGQSVKIGNVMDVFENSKIDSMYVFISNTETNVGQEFKGEIWKLNSSDEYELLVETDFTPITSGMLGKEVKLPLNNIVNVSAGDDLLVMASHEGGTTAVRFGLAQVLPDQYVLGYTATGTSPFYISGMNAVRVGVYMNPSASIIENKGNVVSVATIYPNPTNGLSNLSYSLNTASDVTVKMIDVTGKVISTNSIKGQVAGSHTLELDATELKNGVYYVTIYTDEETVTKKLVKK